MSTFTVPVIRVKSIQKHPNADTLSFIDVDGVNVIFRTGDFHEGDLAVYVPVEAVVPLNRAEFAFLKTKDGQETHRVKAKRLRGLYSEGLLVPVEFFESEGDDVAAKRGIVKYEQPEQRGSITGKIGQAAPDIKWAPRYDVEPLLKNRFLCPEGTPVHVTEKLHGSSARFAYGPDVNGKYRLHVGSHNVWRRPLYRPVFGQKPTKREPVFRRWLNKLLGKTHFEVEPINDCIWWNLAKKYNLEEKLKRFPRMVVYGEVYGDGVQDLKYGLKGEIGFRVFEVYSAEFDLWLSPADVKVFCSEVGLEMVPVLYEGPYQSASVDPMRSGKSTLDPNTIREGIVIKPMYPDDPRWHALKLVSEEYKLRKGGTEYH